MIKNKIIRRIVLCLLVVVFCVSTVNTTFGFIATKTDSLINTFVPFDTIISNLLISKSVEHPFGDEYVIPEEISFDFKIDFGAFYAKSEISTTAGKVVTDENGSVLVSIKPGKAFVVDGIDSGTKVTVTEIQKEGSGFAVKGGNAVMDGVVAEDGSLKFGYVNTYTPASVKPTNVFLKGEKILTGRDWQKGDSFTFTLEQKQENGSFKTLGTKTVTYSAENSDFNSFDFTGEIGALTFNKVGVYDFRLSEVKGKLEDIDYDKTVNTFTINVTDIDMDGKLEINTVNAANNAKVSQKDGIYNIFVTFNNKHIPTVPTPEEITVNIDVNKTVKNMGKANIGPEGFQFVLKNNENGAEMKAISNENGKATFALSFTSLDIGNTYTYKLSETNKGTQGITYDTKVYDVSVTVILGNDGKLTANVVMNGESTQNPVAEFTNIYGADTPEAGDNSGIEVWFALMIISGCACVILVIIGKKQCAGEKD